MNKNNCLIFNPYYHNASYKADIARLSAALEWEPVLSTEFLGLPTGLGKIKDAPRNVLFWDKDIVLGTALTASGSRLFNSIETIRICDDKSLTHVCLADAGVDVPPTICLPFTYSNIGYDDFGFVEALIEKLGFPMVVKECSSSYGMGVYLVNNHAQLIETIKNTKARLIAQKYINTNYDIRVYVVGGAVATAYLRRSKDGFRSNVAQGGMRESYNISAGEKELAVRAAAAVGADFCGVDIIHGEQPFVLEVNSNAHIPSGTNVEENIADYIKKIVNRYSC